MSPNPMQPSIKKVVNRGHLQVSVPLFIFLIGGIQVAKILLKKELIGGLAATLIILAGLAIGWLWWSIAIVKWKLWAYRLIDDHEAPKRRLPKVDSPGLKVISLNVPNGGAKKIENNSKRLKRNHERSVRLHQILYSFD